MHGDPVDRAVALRDAAVLELLYGSGLRVGEVAGLTVERSTSTVAGCWYGKGVKEREVPLSDDAVDAAGAWLARGAWYWPCSPEARLTSRCSSIVAADAVGAARHPAVHGTIW